MIRTFRGLLFTALLVTLSSVTFALANSPPMTGTYSGGTGCGLSAVTAAATKIFGAALFVEHYSGSGTGPTVGGGTFRAGGVICRFRRPADMLYVSLVVTDKAEQIFQDSRGSMTVKQNGSATLAESPGHVIGYSGDKLIDVRWEMLPSGKSNSSVSGATLEPVAMALICGNGTSC